MSERQSSSNWGNQLLRIAWRQIRKLVILVVGGTLVLIGVIMLVTPGPAFVVIPLGLLVLSTEFLWARRLLRQVRDKIAQATGQAVDTDKLPDDDSLAGRAAAKAMKSIQDSGGPDDDWASGEAKDAQ